MNPVHNQVSFASTWSLKAWPCHKSAPTIFHRRGTFWQRGLNDTRCSSSVVLSLQETGPWHDWHEQYDGCSAQHEVRTNAMAVVLRLLARAVGANVALASLEMWAGPCVLI
eukprot:1375249-Amphidinium_carterae.1